MKKKPGLTKEQHDCIGRTLQTMRDNHIYLSAIIDAAYPRNEKAYNLNIKTLTFLDKLRARLDERAFVDNHNVTVSDQLYYRGHRTDYREPEALQTILSELRKLLGW